ncbi:MAG: translation initiation factor IF-2 N-terminal domain-containing protein, partial [Thermodesulfobacteriota bacterium]|nr:translation initiation factor IF-2 N-terminal domain-containing protein [Thermodesulfobacteriota bacterium]
MGKVRVYELAKKMGLENKDLLAKLAAAKIEVSSHSSSLADEDLRKFEDFINPPEEKLEEARIKPGIIRRRRKVVRQSVAELSEVEETVTPDSAASVEKEPVAVDIPVKEAEELPAREAEELPAKEEPVAASEAAVVEVTVDEPEVAPAAVVAGDSKEVVADKPAEEKIEATAKTVVATQDSAEKPKKVKKTSAEKTTGNRAKILGRVELPQTPPAGQRKSRGGERPARQDKRPVARPAARPVRPGATPAQGRKRVDPAPLAPVEQPLPEKEGRNKKRKKGRRDDNANANAQDGRVSRRGRRVEVFEPGRPGSKKRRGGKQSKQAKQTEVTVSKAI